MKQLIVLLCILNVMIFAYFQISAAQAPQGHQPLPELHPEKVQIITEQAAAALPASSETTIPADACYDWGDFSNANLSQAQAAIAALGLPFKAQEKPAQEAKRWWIYIPPAGSLPNAQKKVEVLKQRGIEPSLIVQEPNMRFAISLGMFQDEALANRFYEALKNKGIKTAIKAERQPEAAKTVLLISKVGVDQLEALNQVKAKFPETELKAASCH